MKENDVVINPKKVKYGILLTTKTKWYKRLWVIITNPFYYVITGNIRW